MHVGLIGSFYKNMHVGIWVSSENKKDEEEEASWHCFTPLRTTSLSHTLCSVISVILDSLVYLYSTKRGGGGISESDKINKEYGDLICIIKLV